MPSPKEHALQKKENEDAAVKTTRVRQADMMAAIFRPQQDKMEIDEDDTRNVLVFTLFGEHNGLVDEHGNLSDVGYPALADKNDVPAEDLDNAYAMSTTVGIQTKYYVKRGRDGRMYDPMGLYTELNNRSPSQLFDGRLLWEFKEVDKFTFFQYLNFLKTKNQAYLVSAQRGLV